MKNFSMILLLGLSGCASLANQVQDNIHKGDSKQQVRDELGEPRSFVPVGGGEIWVYVRRSYRCAVGFEKDLVVEMACGDNPDYINPAAAMLMGMGSGLQNANKNRTTCYTNGGDGSYTTSCR